MKRILSVLILLVAATVSADVPGAPKSPATQPATKPFDSIFKADKTADRTADIRYGDAPGVMGNLLDIYQPKTDHPLPAIVWIHGGGWAAGDKFPCPITGFARHGFVVVSINYRFTNTATFPAQLEDCKRAIRFLRANAAKYNIDPDHIGVFGASAGGHLVALLGTSGGDPKAEGTVGGNADQSSRVQAVCDWFGPTDMSVFFAQSKEAGLQFKDGPKLLTALFGGSVESKPELVQQANPISYINDTTAKTIPPFLIMHGDHDQLVPVAQSRLLADALKKAGVSEQFQVIKNAGHGDGFDRPDIAKTIADFFEQTLKKP